MANEYLTRTPTSTGNRKTWTWGAWVKINNPDTSGNTLFCAASDQQNRFWFRYRSAQNSSISVTQTQSSVGNIQIGTQHLVRDVSSWHHIMVAYDSTKVGDSNNDSTIDMVGSAVKLYMNGVRYIDYQSETFVASNNNIGEVNKTIQHLIGNTQWSTSTPATLQFSDIFFVDGQALTPDVFGFYKDGDGYISVGSTQATDFRPGQWSPHSPAKIKKDVNRRGGFGVNGFYLPMNDSSNPGADFHMTPNSIIKLKGEDLPQPRNGAPTTSDAFVSQLRQETGTLGFDGVVKFDGNQGLSVADTAALDLGTGDFTIEGFYYFKPSATGYPALFDGRGSGSDGVYPSLFRDQNSDKLYYYVNSAVRIDNMPMRHNEWMHVAICRSSGTTRAFVDGRLAGSFADTFNYICNDLFIGQSVSNSNDIFGFVSNFRIVKGTALYTANFTAPTSPLENVTNTILLCANSSTSTTASTVTPSTITAIGSPIATRNELTGSISLAVPGIALENTNTELVTNGTFDSNITGWTGYNSTPTWDSVEERLAIDAATEYDGAETSSGVSVSVNTTYTLEVDVNLGTAAGVRLQVRDSSNSSNVAVLDVSGSGTYAVNFDSASNTSVYIRLMTSAGNTGTAYFDNVSIKEAMPVRDYSADIKGSGSNKTIIPGNVSIRITGNYYGSALTGFSTDPATFIQKHEDFRFGSDDFTVEAWIYVTDDTVGTSSVLSLYNYPDNRRSWSVLKNSGGGIRFVTSDDGTYNSTYNLDPNVSLPMDQWNHVAVEKEGNTGRVYQNGVCVGINTNFPTSLYSNVDDNILFGAGISTYMGSNGTQFTNGQIQDVRVYKGLAKYKGGFDVPKPYTPVGIEAFRTTDDTCKNNFATFNPLRKSSNQTLSDGNLTCTQAGTVWGAASSTIGMDESSGKYYVEYRVESNTYSYIGIANVDSLIFDLATVPSGYSFMGATANDWGYLSSSGGIQHNNSNLESGGTILSAGYILGITFDTSNKEAKWYVNGVLQYTTTLTGNYPFFFGSGSYESSNVVNFGQNPSFSGTVTAGTNADDSGKGLFKYAPPSGFLALCTDNLPTPAIADPGKHFKSVLYTGSGSTRGITGVGFKPDLVWIKERSSTSSHHIFDSVRGATLKLYPNSTSAEIYSSTQLYSFDSGGFSNGTSGGTNQSGEKYVAWCWKAGGAAVSNSDGSITSQVSVNQTAGFSIVSYTGDEANNATVGHGLGKSPDMVIIKDRDSNTAGNNWYVFHSAFTSGHYGKLNSTSATSAVSGTSNGGVGSVTSTTFNFTQGSSNNKNVNESGDKFIAYCWTSILGYSKFGSYEGNDDDDGTFVYCGFKPAFVMVKNIDAINSWYMHDSSRTSTNPSNDYLSSDSSAVETTATTVMDILSNGFKLRNGSYDGYNGDYTYIFMAFAESPFQTTNAK